LVPDRVTGVRKVTGGASPESISEPGNRGGLLSDYRNSSKETLILYQRDHGKVLVALRYQNHRSAKIQTRWQDLVQKGSDLFMRPQRIQSFRSHVLQHTPSLPMITFSCAKSRTCAGALRPPTSRSRLPCILS